MKRFAWAAITAALSAVPYSASAATGSVSIHAEGVVSSFMAIFEVKGPNCSQYNPCNPTDPSSFDTVSYGNLKLGQSFTFDMVIDASTGNTISSSWVSGDGKATFGSVVNGSVYNRISSASPNPGVTFQSILGAAANGTPKSLTTILNFQLPGADTSSAASITSSLAAAAEQGLIAGVTGSATFDSCRMFSPGVYAAACTSRMGFTLSSVSVNGLSVVGVPEPASWASMGLGLLALGGALRARRRMPAAGAAQQVA